MLIYSYNMKGIAICQKHLGKIALSSPDRHLEEKRDAKANLLKIVFFSLLYLAYLNTFMDINIISHTSLSP